MRAGCPWRLLPSDLPPWGTIYRWFAKFRDDGLLEKINHSLVKADRERVGREASPSGAIIDSQSVKTTKAGGVPSIYSIVPPNDGSALRHGHHFEPVDFVIDHGRGRRDAYSAGSCQRTGMRMSAACTSPQRGLDRIRAGVVRPRGVRNDDADRRPWARKRPFRTRPAERIVHPVCPCRATSGSLNRDNSSGMSQECATNAAR